ncbi:hypothetical protein BH23PSE1_BH23PSE1_16560 [soil metagenome]
MQDIIGIDISKDRLDAFRLSDRQHNSFGNDKAGFKALLKWIGDADGLRIVYEPTGPYHRGMEQALATPRSMPSWPSAIGWRRASPPPPPPAAAAACSTRCSLRRWRRPRTANWRQRNSMGLNLVIAVTDGDWFDMLRQQPNLAEVNFWAPSAANFRALQPGL